MFNFDNNDNNGNTNNSSNNTNIISLLRRLHNQNYVMGSVTVAGVWGGPPRPTSIYPLPPITINNYYHLN